MLCAPCSTCSYWPVYAEGVSGHLMLRAVTRHPRAAKSTHSLNDAERPRRQPGSFTSGAGTGPTDGLSPSRSGFDTRRLHLLCGGYASLTFPQRTLAAFRASSERWAGVRRYMRAKAPLRPRATAAGSFLGTDSGSACPVATRTTSQARWEASPLTRLRFIVSSPRNIQSVVDCTLDSSHPAHFPWSKPLFQPFRRRPRWRLV